jgi:hypothetical protein
MRQEKRRPPRYGVIRELSAKNITPIARTTRPVAIHKNIPYMNPITTIARPHPGGNSETISRSTKLMDLSIGLDPSLAIRNLCAPG